ncbi:hypothetical protein L207DRAFT_582063 [Hyaloscypha variabilis F]|uniref:BTB domain-containing protein n=1 Tax=Hyaloscypha variabilis (strain UAMH 11265 / GT02V1 / F) TaxID=1149755 RepID=A0A2J6RSY1_HYAVF|nr:hypothetical protein L207DRAFT_582063 [Hyaloscypha variabilis F]
MVLSVEFASNGDLRLHIGGNNRHSPSFPPFDAIVCSRTLSRISAVFEAMLRSEYQMSRDVSKAKKQKNCECGLRDWCVKLEDGSVLSVWILLAITHSQFMAVPDRLPLAELYELLILCDKYLVDLQIIRPWAGTWFQQHASLAGSPGNEILLFVSRELGSMSTFETVVHRIFNDSEVNATGQFVDSSGRPLEDYISFGLDESLGEHNASF